MQFSLARCALRKALDQLQFAFLAHDRFQECLKITLHDGQLSFSLANAKVYVTSTMVHAEGTPGDALLHYPTLQKVLECFQGDILHVQYDGAQAMLSDEKMMVMLRDCPPVQGFPMHPKLRYVKSLNDGSAIFQRSWQLRLPARTWQHLVKMVAGAALPAGCGQVLEGVMVRVQGDALTLVAADKVRMHMMDICVPGAGTWDETPVVPANLLVQATESIAGSEEVRISTMTILLQDGNGKIYHKVPSLSLKTEAREVSMILRSETYPDAFRLLSKEQTTQATCESSALRKALAQLRSAASVLDAVVQVHFGPEALLLEVPREDGETPIRLSIPAQINGEETMKKYRWAELYEFTKLNRDSKITFECGPSNRTRILLEKEPTFQALIASSQ